MLDRASTFADPQIVELLKTRFVPIAIDQAYQRRQQDAEGEFYRRIAGQGPRNDFNGTTQGLYVAAPDGTLLGFTNNRSPDRVKRLLDSAGDVQGAEAIKPQQRRDPRYNPTPPKGGLVIRVMARVLGGYAPTDNRWQKIFQTATSRDNLWISRAEHAALVRGDVPVSLQRRIARFHLVDNTRGEPPMWRADEIRSLSMSLQDGRLSGSVELSTRTGDRRFRATLLGEVKVADGVVTRFDVVAKGLFRGDGRYTRNAPKGDFPLAVAFRLADGSDVADRIPPQGSRGWVPGYIQLPR